NVAWCVTHAMADTQDLYVEQFDPERPSRYRWLNGWREAEVRRETVLVRGAAPVTVEAVVTHHGPVIAGETARGHAVALRYTALQPGNRGWDCLLPMLRASSCDELRETMRGWVDPANNFLMADTHGDIAYRTRGQVPTRHPLNAWIPVPGWTGEYEWTGIVPFGEMPAQKNPATGWILTANNRIVGPEYPHYLSHFYAPDDRAQRIRAHLAQAEPVAMADLLDIHADILSRPAPHVIAALKNVSASNSLVAAAKRVLMGWDGRMAADQAAPLIYSALREEVLAAILKPLLGPMAEEPFTTPGAGAPGLVGLLRRRLGLNVAMDDASLLPPGRVWSDVLAEALAKAVAGLAAHYGEDVRAWRWGEPHALRPMHPLAAVRPALCQWLNPPSAPMGGDGDTVQAAGYHPTTGFKVTSTSVARYCFDPADWDRSGWVVPYGVSGHPGSPHYADQQPAWLEHRLLPMLYAWQRIEATAQSRQMLNPVTPAG
ncbi:MAG: penicillin acylase family protein, partial [Chloroflexota bacterium]